MSEEKGVLIVLCDKISVKVELIAVKYLIEGVRRVVDENYPSVFYDLAKPAPELDKRSE